MLNISKEFEIVTYPENDVIVERAIGDPYSLILGKYYYDPSKDMVVTKEKASRVRFHCKTQLEHLDEVIANLNDAFKETWASITY